MIELTGDTWQRWEKKRLELAATGRWDLAGLFRGHEGPNFREAPTKILYVGKATAGPFDTEDASEKTFGCNSGPFWSFAKRLSRLAKGNPDELGHIAWSNLCKIGTVTGNPDRALVNAQAELAAETLRQEWLELEPSLIVCVAVGYQEQLVYSALGVTQNDNDGFEEIPCGHASSLWRRPTLDGVPAFLWMKHPQGKLNEYLDAAESLAHEMLSFESKELMEGSEIPTQREKYNGALWFSQPGVVYFVAAGSECEDCKSVKIGVTLREGLLKRLRSIQSANHTKVRLLRVIEFASMREAERKEGELHHRFRDEAKLPKGIVGAEWFRATDRIMQTIEEEAVLPQNMVDKPKGLATIQKLFV